MKLYTGILGIMLFVLLGAFKKPNELTKEPVKPPKDFVYQTEAFADKKILRYKIDGFDKLTLKQKQLVYCLSMAGLAGRDIDYAQKHRFNIPIRKALEKIITNYKGDKNSKDWKSLEFYAKQVWFSNGIYHHYSGDKFIPEFSLIWFVSMLLKNNITLPTDIINLMFDPKIEPKRLDQSNGIDMILASSVNFHAPEITQKDHDAYYKPVLDRHEKEPLEYGLNSRLEKDANGNVFENVIKSGGLYGSAVDEMIKWLLKASKVAENEAQKKAIDLLIEYYQTGDLAKWRDYNIAWIKATEGDIDYNAGFVEVYHDPAGMRGSFQSIVYINDFELSAKMKKLSANGQWFEDNSPLSPAHKKSKVLGITYNMGIVVSESGDASPVSAIGENLPNSNWLRETYGSKSVSFSNLETANSKSTGSGLTTEFSNDQEEINRAIKYGEQAGKMHTALHEVLGHASGVMEPGVQEPHVTLKNYASPLEEARADLFALYYIMDPKLVELGLVPSDEVGKTEYDQYIKNGLMLQLRRIIPGNNIEQAHMRNRQMIANWVFQHGQKDNVIEKMEHNGKTFFNINDYAKLRVLFSELLREVQRIKSQGDYTAGKALIEDYGVKVDSKLHLEILKRSESLKIPPYSGFINPEMVPVYDAKGNITNVKIKYPTDFKTQMLDYGKKYSFLK
ncbi:MAG: dihydrofolate reductase [Saprospiraceae bacterium]